MVLTAGCVLIVMAGSVLLGVPVAWLLNGRRPLDEDDWLQAPLLGLSAVVLLLYNLIWLDQRVRATAPFLWAAAIALCVWLAVSALRRRAREQALDAS